MAIPTFDIESLTALLTFFVCFHGSEKKGSSGSEKNIFNTEWSLYIMFSFSKQYRKISILPSQKGLEFPVGGGFCKNQYMCVCVCVCVKLYWNFQRGGGGGGVLEKLPSVGEVWIFSGVTHCLFIWLTNLRRML